MDCKLQVLIIGYCTCMGIYCVERFLLAELPELLHNFLRFNIAFIKFFDLICLFQNLKSDKNLFHPHTVLSWNFQHWLLMMSTLLEICKQKRGRVGILFQILIMSSSINIFDRQIFHKFLVTVHRKTNILVIFHVFMKYCVLKSS